MVNSFTHTLRHCFCQRTRAVTVGYIIGMERGLGGEMSREFFQRPLRVQSFKTGWWLAEMGHRERIPELSEGEKWVEALA